MEFPNGILRFIPDSGNFHCKRQPGGSLFVPS